MKNTKSLMKQLALLIGVFIFGINAVMLTDYLFINFEKELDDKTINLKARIKLGEFIVEDLFKIKSDFYELDITNKKRTRQIITQRLKGRVNSIKSSLDILDNGGVLKRVIKLNIPGHINDTKYLEFKKTPKDNLSLETIDIYPKLNDLLAMTTVLNALLDTKKQYEKEKNLEKVKIMDRRIRRFYKTSPAFFTRITENTRRLLFEGENELKKIEQEIKKKKKFYSYIEFLVIIITILLVLAVSYMITRQISKNSKRLNNLNKELADRVLAVQKQEIFTRGVLDTQSSIVIINDGKEMIDANKALFEFFDEYKTIKEYQDEHECICELFVIPEDVTNQNLYITDKKYNGKSWIEYILNIKNTPHKAAIYKKNKLHHFNIYAQKMTINEDEFIIIISLNDITHEISHQKRLKVLNSSLKDSIADVKNLLNNANQGFLSFSKDLTIKPQYSKKCYKFFINEIAGDNIATLLYKLDIKKRNFFTKTLKTIDFNDKEIKNSAILSLLEKEFVLNKRVVKVEYKMLENETYMLILTDVTEKRVLEKKINREKKILKMVVSVVSNKEEFFELLNAYRNFYQKFCQLIEKDKTPLHNISVLYRSIHTFKGLYLQKELIYTPHFLHTIETTLSNMIDSNKLSNESLLERLKEGDFEKSLAKDLEILKDILGEEFLEKDIKLRIKEEEIEAIEEKISKLSHQCNICKDVLKDLKNLKNRPISTFFSSYPKLVNQLSERLEKPIYPLEIVVDRDLTLSYDMKPFAQSLIHLFRNAMDHGIESSMERLLTKKDEIGTISCNIYEESGKLNIIIADDGRGINIEKLKLKAKELNIDTTNFEDEEILNLIFSDNFTTKDKISDISGRGVGLSALKEQLEMIDGKVSIKTKLGQGSTFHFLLPT